MQWWSNVVDWSGSDHGWQIISGAIIPFVAIVVAGIVAALIGRGATKRVVAMQEREARNAAVAGIISAARKAATWGSLGHDERGYADHLAEDADIRLRLLPVSGAPVAANWAQHEIADIKKNSSTFSFQAEQSLAEFRDRMLEWQARPARARKLFRQDLERWKFEAPDADADLINRQQAWNADQVDRGRDQARDAGGRGASAPGTSASAPAASAAASAPVLVSSPAAPADASTAPGTAAASAPTPAPASTSAPAPAPAPAPAQQDAARLGAARPAAPAAAERTDALADAARTTPAASTIRPASTPTSRVESDRVSRDDPDLGEAEAAPLTAPKVDAAAPASTTTASIPTRLREEPAGHADPHETDEAPYGSPVSASELRRRAADDDE